MRQEEYNYEHNVAIDSARNLTGAVGGLGNAISNTNFGTAISTRI